MHWRRQWQPTPVFLPEKSQGLRSLVGCCIWGHTELDTTEAHFQWASRGHFFVSSLIPQGFAGSSDDRLCLQCRRPRFNPWVGKIPWRRKCQPTPVVLPGEFHGQKSLAGYSPWGHKRVRHDLATKQQHCCCQVASVVSGSARPHRRQPTRVPSPWDSPLLEWVAISFSNA